MGDDLQVRFGLRLRELRRERGLAQSELAELAEVSSEYVSRIERGVVGPSFEVVEKLAHGLGVEPRELFDFVAAVPRPTSSDAALLRLSDLYRRGTRRERRLLLELAEVVIKSGRRHKR